MLAAKRLPEVLRSVLSDGVEGAVVMTVEGSVMASEFISPSSSSPSSSSATAAGGNPLLNETSIAAISATIWNNCSLVYSGPNELNYHIMKFDKGILAIASVSKGYLVAIYGANTTIGLMKGRIDALCQFFSRIFEQMK